MRFTILSTLECSKLRPDTYYLIKHRYARLDEDISYRLPNHKFSLQRVLDVPAIVITNDDFILQGKHRAYRAYTGMDKLEACVVNNESDIARVPKDLLDMPLEDAIDTYRRRQEYMEKSMDHGVRFVAHLEPPLNMPEGPDLSNEAKILLWGNPV